MLRWLPLVGVVLAVIGAVLSVGSWKGRVDAMQERIAAQVTAAVKENDDLRTQLHMLSEDVARLRRRMERSR